MADPVVIPGLPPGVGTAIGAWAKGFFGSRGGTFGPAINARIDSLPPELQRETRGTVRDISRSSRTGREKARDINRVVRDAETEAGRIESEEQDDPFQYDPPEPIDQQLSPVFEGAAVGVGLGVGMSDAVRKALEKQLTGLEKKLKIATPTTSIKVVVNKFGKVATAKIPKTVEQRAANILIKSAQRAVGPVSKVAKKIPKVGGPAGTLGTIGAQLGLEKISQVVTDRQFAEQEKILRKQQRETDKVVKQIRRQQQGSAPPPGPVKPPTGGPRAPRPASTAAGARPPVGATELEPIRPNLPAKKLEILGPGTPLTTMKVGGPGALAKALQFAKNVAPFIGLANMGSGNKQAFAPAVPSSSRQTSSSQSSFFGSRLTAQSGGLCECKPKARKATSNKKRRAPRVCVSKTVAARAGIAA